MNKKRTVITTIIGFLLGLFCMYGTTIKFPGQYGPLILAAIVYNRALTGFVIGISNNIKIHPIIRGAILGAIVTI